MSSVCPGVPKWLIIPNTSARFLGGLLSKYPTNLDFPFNGEEQQLVSEHSDKTEVTVLGPENLRNMVSNQILTLDGITWPAVTL